MSAQWPDGPVTSDDAEEATDGEASAEPREDTPGDASAEPREDTPGDASAEPVAQPERAAEDTQAAPQGAPETPAEPHAAPPEASADESADADSADESDDEGTAFESATDEGDGGADEGADEDDDAPMYTTERAPEPVVAAPLAPPAEPAPEPVTPQPATETPAATAPQAAADGNGAATGEGDEEPDEEADTGPKITPVEGSEWYILQTYSGFENRVKKTIEEKLRVAALEQLVEEVFVPGEDVTRVKNGRKRSMHVIYFPGYVLIKMKLTDDLWHLLMDIPRVAGFVGGNNREPQALGEDELSHIRSQMSEGYRQATLKEEFEIGQQVIVIDGPFANFSGKIDEVNAEKSKLRVLISILGRSTPVELDFDKVKAHPDAG